MIKHTVWKPGSGRSDTRFVPPAVLRAVTSGVLLSAELRARGIAGCVPLPQAQRGERPSRHDRRRRCNAADPATTDLLGVSRPDGHEQAVGEHPPSRCGLAHCDERGRVRRPVRLLRFGRGAELLRTRSLAAGRESRSGSVGAATLRLGTDHPRGGELEGSVPDLRMERELRIFRAWTGSARGRFCLVRPVVCSASDRSRNFL